MSGVSSSDFSITYDSATGIVFGASLLPDIIKLSDDSFSIRASAFHDIAFSTDGAPISVTGDVNHPGFNLVSFSETNPLIGGIDAGSTISTTVSVPANVSEVSVSNASAIPINQATSITLVGNPVAIDSSTLTIGTATNCGGTGCSTPTDAFIPVASTPVCCTTDIIPTVPTIICGADMTCDSTYTIVYGDGITPASLIIDATNSHTGGVIVPILPAHNYGDVSTGSFVSSTTTVIEVDANHQINIENGVVSISDYSVNSGTGIASGSTELVLWPINTGSISSIVTGSNHVLTNTEIAVLTAQSPVFQPAIDPNSFSFGTGSTASLPHDDMLSVVHLPTDIFVHDTGTVATNIDVSSFSVALVGSDLIDLSHATFA